MKHLRSVIALAALVGCVTEPVEQPPFFEAAVFQLQDDVPLMAFQGEDYWSGWSYSPDPAPGYDVGLPDGVSTGFQIETGAPGLDGSGYVTVRVRTYGIAVPPRAATYDVARVDEPLDPDRYGTMFGHFTVTDRDRHEMVPGWRDEATTYDIVEGSITVDDIGPDALASGTITVTGEARRPNGRPPVLLLEGSFRTRKGPDAVCMMIDNACHKPEGTSGGRP